MADVELAALKEGEQPQVATPVHSQPDTPGNDFVQAYHKVKTVITEEIPRECFPSFTEANTNVALDFVKKNVHIPYLPALWRPGWLTNYIRGPYNAQWADDLFGDFTAGITVSLTLIPQALSYATLAGLPPVYGLYAAIVPASTYALLGSSMQLSVGATAILSLLTGNVLSKKGANSATDLDFAVDIAAQCAFQAGLLLFVFSFLNTGHLIRFISYPVISGFTTGAAMTIGLSQIKNAFGFGSEVPSVGGTGTGQVRYDYQLMHWYIKNWNGTKIVKKVGKVYYRNPHATAICFGLFIPMFLLQFVKKIIKATPERRKTIWFQVWTVFVNTLPLAAILIGARIAKDIITSAGKTPADYYARTLKIVGDVPSGLNIIRQPHFREPFWEFFGDILPLTLILYMESYGIARKIAVDFGFLSILNASQEMFSVGLANMLGSVASAFPVCGSFSRSALNANSGAMTPLSKCITVLCIVTATATLTSTFHWIPQAALSAVIMVALLSLVDVQALWNAWKYSKKDFLVMITTLVITFCFDTGTGLATGIILSVILLLRDMAFNLEAKPVAKSVSHGGVVVIRLHTNLVFVSGGRIKDSLYEEVFKRYDTEEGSVKAIVLDFVDVHFVDLTGLVNMKEVIDDARSRNIPVVIVNVLSSVERHLTRIGIESDKIDDAKLEVSIKEALPLVGRAGAREKGLEEESLATVDNLIREEVKH